MWLPFFNWTGEVRTCTLVKGRQGTQGKDTTIEEDRKQPVFRNGRYSKKKKKKTRKEHVSMTENK